LKTIETALKVRKPLKIFVDVITW